MTDLLPPDPTKPAALDAVARKLSEQAAIIEAQTREITDLKERMARSFALADEWAEQAVRLQVQVTNLRDCPSPAEFDALRQQLAERAATIEDLRTLVSRHALEIEILQKDLRSAIDREDFWMEEAATFAVDLDRLRAEREAYRAADIARTTAADDQDWTVL